MPITSYKKYEADQRIPGGEALAGLAGAGVNLSELLIGPQDAPGPHANRLEQPSAGYVYLPLYEQSAGAANSGRLVSAEHPVTALAFREDWIRHELRAAPDQLRLIYVEGDSMEPDLRAGDIILVDVSASSPQREGIYVVRMDDALLVKHVQRLPGGVVKLTSRNPIYEPVLLPLPSFEPGGAHSIVGRVVWVCRRL